MLSLPALVFGVVMYWAFILFLLLRVRHERTPAGPILRESVARTAWFVVGLLIVVASGLELELLVEWYNTTR